MPNSLNWLRFIPAVRIMAGDWKVKPYVKLGLVISVLNQTQYIKNRTVVNTAGVEKFTEQTKMGKGIVSFGFADALGANYPLPKNFGIFAEMGLIAQSYAPTHCKITKLTMDGVDQLQGITTRDIEMVYVDHYSHSSPASPDIKNHPYETN